MKIQVDVDQTLYDSETLFKEVAEEHFSVHLTPYPTNWHDYLDDAAWDVLHRIFRKAHSDEYVTRQEPYPYASEVLTGLADKGHTIYYVSDRHPQARGALVRWLESNGFPITFNEYSVVTGMDKREWMRETKPDIVIDDRVRTMILAYTLGAKVFSLIHPHNINLYKEIDGITLCPDWAELGVALREVT